MEISRPIFRGLSAIIIRNLPDNNDVLLRLVAVSDRFFTKTLGSQSPEGFILEKERDAIDFEVRKIMKFMQLDMR